MAKAYQAAAPWLNAVWLFVGSALVGVAGGYGVDRWLETKPFGLLVGGLAGSCLGFFAFIRATSRLLEKKQ